MEFLTRCYVKAPTRLRKVRARSTSSRLFLRAVEVMEDSDLFNAGHGAVFTAAGTHELDASVATGDGRCGGVAGTTQVRNPVRAARAVLEGGRLVLVTGKGADDVARAAGCAMVENAYFSTAWRREQLAAAQAAARVAGAEVVLLDHSAESAAAAAAATAAAAGSPIAEDSKRGTVGAVCLDAHGHLAAATSTGGMTNKVPGRVGDTPLIGAGTIATPRVAVSGTGVGEAFMRTLAAKDLDARMLYAHESVVVAAQAVVDALDAAGGDGGVIAVDASGAVAMPFSTEGMYRGVARVAAVGGAHDVAVAIYREDRG